MKDGKRHPERPAGSRLRSAVLTGVMCLTLLAAGGCGFITGFFEDEPKGGETVKKTVKKIPAKKKADDKKTAEAEQPVLDKEEKERLTLQKLKEMQEAKNREFVFLPTGMLDPFMPIEAIVAPSNGKKNGNGDKGKKLPPLQMMALSQLKLVAVVEAPGNTRALVEDSAGIGYIIKIGTKMGTRKGQVVSIQKNVVEVEEHVKNYMGEEKVKITKLKLHPIEGEEK